MWGLFSFRGRTSRLGYWRVQLFATAFVALFWMLGLFAMMGAGPIGGVLFAPALLAFLAVLATWVRRLHDRGKGGWWALFFILAPSVLDGVAQMINSPDSVAAQLEALPLALAGLAIGVWALIEVGFRRGQQGSNRFGDPPAA